MITIIPAMQWSTAFGVPGAISRWNVQIWEVDVVSYLPALATNTARGSSKSISSRSCLKLLALVSSERLESTNAHHGITNRLIVVPESVAVKNDIGALYKLSTTVLYPVRRFLSYLTTAASNL